MGKPGLSGFWISLAYHYNLYDRGRETDHISQFSRQKVFQIFGKKITNFLLQKSSLIFECKNWQK